MQTNSTNADRRLRGVHFGDGQASPSIDYRCTHCGAERVYQLVPVEERPTQASARAIPREVASIDFSCAHCGDSQTYKIVPESVRR